MFLSSNDPAQPGGNTKRQDPASVRQAVEVPVVLQPLDLRLAPAFKRLLQLRRVARREPDYGAGDLLEVAAVPLVEPRQVNDSGLRIETEPALVSVHVAGLIVELGVDSIGCVGLAAQRRAADGGADEREVDARLDDLGRICSCSICSRLHVWPPTFQRSSDQRRSRGCP